MRIGYGYDIHRFTNDRPLVLGGVTIPYDRGLAGHSDADVLLHALADALLGAAALGDIGLHFPDTDAVWEGADSRVLLERVMSLVRDEGYRLGNADITVILERPKLRPHIDAMRSTTAATLDVETEQISVKATTAEGLGALGQAAGAAAQAVCLLLAD